jgi:hypothetical protein
MSEQPPTLNQTINSSVPRVRRKPRYILGTFWMLIGLASLIFAFTSSASGHLNGLWAGPLLIAYAVYLYRGGRWGFFIF